MKTDPTVFEEICAKKDIEKNIKPTDQIFDIEKLKTSIASEMCDLLESNAIDVDNFLESNIDHIVDDAIDDYLDDFGYETFLLEDLFAAIDRAGYVLVKK